MVNGGVGYQPPVMLKCLWAVPIMFHCLLGSFVWFHSETHQFRGDHIYIGECDSNSRRKFRYIDIEGV